MYYVQCSYCLHKCSWSCSYHHQGEDELPPSLLESEGMEEVEVSVNVIATIAL